MGFSVDIIGTYPPPIGGTSIHVERLHRKNLEAGVDTVTYDTYVSGQQQPVRNDRVVNIKNYKKFLLKYMLNRRADIIHSHSHSWVERMVLVIKAKLCGQKIVFTFHSLRDEKDKFGKLQNFAYRFTLNNADRFIATSPQIKEKLENWGAEKDKISVIRPFLSPSKDDGMGLEMEVKKFLESHKFIISANASNNDHYNNNDLYGIDMAIELINSLKERHDCACVFVLTKTTDKKYLNELKSRIINYDIADRFLLIEGCVDFISLLKESTVFIRPTNTDSWGISISEALSLNVPSIASDVCQREEGTILFESRNQDELNKTVESVIMNLEKEREKLDRLYVKDNYQQIYDIYVKLIRK